MIGIEDIIMNRHLATQHCNEKLVIFNNMPLHSYQRSVYISNAATQSVCGGIEILSLPLLRSNVEWNETDTVYPLNSMTNTTQNMWNYKRIKLVVRHELNTAGLLGVSYVVNVRQIYTVVWHSAAAERHSIMLCRTVAPLSATTHFRPCPTQM